jgi:hypothetical protein
VRVCDARVWSFAFIPMGTVVIPNGPSPRVPTSRDGMEIAWMVPNGRYFTAL